MSTTNLPEEVDDSFSHNGKHSEEVTDNSPFIEKPGNKGQSSQKPPGKRSEQIVGNSASTEIMPLDEILKLVPKPGETLSGSFPFIEKRSPGGNSISFTDKREAEDDSVPFTDELEAVDESFPFTER